MRTLICRSLAFDTIMVFPDRFGRHILPDKTHVLSVSFTVGDMRREWGGCAGNIAYNLKALGGAPVVMATIGDDGAPYRERLAALGMGADGVRSLAGSYRAGLHHHRPRRQPDHRVPPRCDGALAREPRRRRRRRRLGIVAPDGRDGMLRARERSSARQEIPFVLDPGQAMTLFSGDELVDMIDAATVVAVNDYEARLIAERTGLAIEEIARRVETLVVTLGAEGSRIHVGGATIHVPAVRPSALVDPTGCGDAHRAALLYGMAQGWDWQKTGRLGSLLGSIKIAARGGQNHAVDRDLVAAMYAKEFGSSPW